MTLRDMARLLAPPELRKSVLNIRFAARRATAKFRTLPDFLIIGTMRGGTSSLYKYLGDHPHVMPSLRKETWYFSNAEHFRRGEDWYRSHFPLKQYRSIREKLSSNKFLAFEASANYMYHPDAPELAFQLLPHAKIIVMLRNPVERLYSHYQFNVRKGAEKRPLSEILSEATTFAEKKIENLQSQDHGRAIHKPFMYFYIGLYALQLEKWRRHFPKENIFIIRSEDFFAQTGKVFDALLTFLGLPAWNPGIFRNYSYWGNRNTGVTVEPLSDKIRQQLMILYEPYNHRLYNLLCHDFQWDS